MGANLCPHHPPPESPSTFSWFVSLPAVPSLPPAPRSSLCTAHTGRAQGIKTTDGVSRCLSAPSGCGGWRVGGCVGRCGWVGGPETRKRKIHSRGRRIAKLKFKGLNLGLAGLCRSLPCPLCLPPLGPPSAPHIQVERRESKPQMGCLGVSRRPADTCPTTLHYLWRATQLERGHDICPKP